MMGVKSGNFNGKLSELFFDIIQWNIKDECWQQDNSDIVKGRAGDILEVDTIGMGVAMLNMRIFKDMKEPYFEKLFKAKTESREYYFGEDISFCIKAKQLNYKIYVDTSVPCGHVCKKKIQTDDYKLAKWMESENKRISQNKKLKEV